MIGRGHNEGIWTLTIHKSILFSAGGDNVIKVWELENLVKGCKKTMTGHTEKVLEYLYSFSLYEMFKHIKTYRPIKI